MKVNMNKTTNGNHILHKVVSTVIKRKDHAELCSWLDQVSREAKLCHNAAVFAMRQPFCTSNKDEGNWSDKEKMVMENWKKLEEGKKKRLNPYSYYSLEAYIKDYTDFRNGESDYLIPAATVQQICKKAAQSFRDFFAACKDWKKHPEKYQNKPHIPNYSRKEKRSIPMTNQQVKCFDRDGKTFARISKFKGVQVCLPEGAGKFCCAEIVPCYDSYRLVLTFEVNKKAVQQKEAKRIAGMDLGSRYLAALTSNDECLLIGGRKLRSQNNRIARRIARLMSLGMMGNPEADWTETRETQRLRKKRKHLVDDYLHKASREIVNWLIRNDIDTLVIGHNKGWKVKPRMSKFFNKAFQPIPHSRLIQMVRYKAEEAGIRVLETEESYTSKASFLDRDVMPVWKPVKEGEKKEDYWFAGRRIKRSLYRDGNGNIIHADLNGAANIARKVFPDYSIPLNTFSRIRSVNSY